MDSTKWNDRRLTELLQKIKSLGMEALEADKTTAEEVQSALAWKLHTDLGMDHQDALVLVSSIYWGGWNTGWQKSKEVAA